MSLHPWTSTDEPSVCPMHRGTTTVASRIGTSLTLSKTQLSERSSAETAAFFSQLAKEQSGAFPHIAQRLQQLHPASLPTSSFELTSAELAYAAKLAWRNNIRCIGRLHWHSLIVRDLRHLTKPCEIFDALVDHLRSATNRGSILPLMSIFTDEPRANFLRIISHQLIRYACYRREQELLGDPQNLRLTDIAIAAGWQPPTQPSAFDILPVLIADQDNHIHAFDLPKDPEVILEVALTHPEYPWFEKLDLRWHAVPAISDMVLDAAGMKFPANVFNGWYMGTEIAARNLADVQRYNVLPVVAEHLGLSIRSERSLWRDRALLELNIAVLHSFERSGVRLVDHHTASKQFLSFSAKEHAEGREVNGDWSWLVPPMSGSTSPLFHRSFAENIEKPGFFYCPWEDTLSN